MKEFSNEQKIYQAEWKAPSEAGPQEFANVPEKMEDSAFAQWCSLNAVPSYSLEEKGKGFTINEKVKEYSKVFKMGQERLVSELKDPNNNEVRLIDNLDLTGIKAGLDALRAQGNVQEASEKEVEIARFFQKAISEYKYNMEMCHIGEILKNKQMNCVGASVLGGALLEKVGIKYLVGHIGEHVLLITLTSDGKVYWQDMQDGLEIPELNNEELTSEKIEGASPVDIVSYAHSPSPEGLRFGVNKKHWEQKIMTALPPETGLELQELISTGFVLGNNNKNDEAIEILEVAKAIYPYEVDVHFGLARAYKNKKMYKQALEACGLAMQYDPGNEYLQGIYQEIESLVGR